MSREVAPPIRLTVAAMVIDALQSWLSDEIPRAIERACRKHQPDLVVPVLPDWTHAALRSLCGRADGDSELRQQIAEAIKPFEVDDLISEPRLAAIFDRLRPSLALRSLEFRRAPIEELDAAGATPAFWPGGPEEFAAHVRAIGVGEITFAWCRAACAALEARRRGRRHQLEYVAFIDAVGAERARMGAHLRLNDVIDAWVLATNDPASRASLRARWRRYLDRYRRRRAPSRRGRLVGRGEVPQRFAMEATRSPESLPREERGVRPEDWMTETAVEAVLTAATFTLASIEEHRRSTISKSVAQAVAGEQLVLVPAPIPPVLRQLFVRLVAVAEALAARGRVEALGEINDAIAPDSIDDVLADQPFRWTCAQLEVALRWRSLCRQLVEPTSDALHTVLGRAGSPPTGPDAVVLLDEANEAIGSAVVALTRFLAVAREGRSLGRPADLEPSAFLAAVHLARRRKHGDQPRERDLLEIWCLATGEARTERLRSKWNRYFKMYRPTDLDLATIEVEVARK